MSNSSRKLSKRTKITPGVRPAQSMILHELGALPFQELCRDLFDAEPSVATCEIYGTPGQSQYGIDLLAKRKGHDGIEVGQCKCCQNFTAGELKTASDEFFKHWSHWSSENVKRFVLLVACELNTTQQQDQILSETKRFAGYGIDYEVWTTTTIRNRLRPHPGIVANHFDPPEYWVKRICGISMTQHSFSASGENVLQTINIAVATQLETLMQVLAGETQQNLHRMRNAWREGRNQEVVDWIMELKADVSRWGTLPSDVKARVLRFEAGLKLDISDSIGEAKQLASDAYQLDPSEKNESRIRSLIARLEHGPVQATKFLTDADDVDSLNLLTAMYMEANDRQNSELTLAKIEKRLEPNAETHRLKALLALVNGNMSQARIDIDTALGLEPNWIAVRFTSAIIYYYSAIAPAMIPHEFILVPEPLDWIVVNRDANSVKYLADATSTLRKLLDHEANTLDRDLIQAWYLATLMINPDNQAFAHEHLKSILLSDPTFPYAITWALTRNLDFDMATSIQRLNELLSSGQITIPKLIAYLGILVKQGEFDKAIKILQANKKIFADKQAETIWVLWNVQVLVAAGKEKRAQQFLNRNLKDAEELRYAQSLIFAAQFSKKGNTAEFGSYLFEQYKQTKDPIYLLRAYEIEFRNRNWDFVNTYGKTLIDTIPTAEVLRLVVTATFKAGQYSQCKALIDENRRLFGSTSAPADIRQLRAACLQAEGKMVDAIAEMESLQQELPSIDYMRQTAQMYVQVGDLKKLAVIGRKFVDMPEVSPDEALNMAELLRHEDSVLAKSLWNKAISSELPDGIVSSALLVGYKLGLDNELKEVSKQFYEAANKGVQGIRPFNSIEEVIKFVNDNNLRRMEIENLYKEGSVPIHALVEREGLLLVDFYHAFLDEKEVQPDPLRQPQLLIRHGGKITDSGELASPAEWRLHVDITSLLLMDHLEIMELIQESFGTLHIPQQVIPSLVAMRESLLPHQPSQVTVYQEIVEAVDANQVSILRTTTSGISDLSPDSGIEARDVQLRTILEKVDDPGGYVLAFSREIEGVSQSSQVNIRNRYLTAGDIVRTLFDGGKIDETQFQAAIEKLGGEGTHQSGIELPHLGSSVYCLSNTISVLSSAGVLKNACQHFKLFIQDEYYLQLKNNLTHQRRRQVSFQKIGSLIEKLRKDVELGKIQIMPLTGSNFGATTNPELPTLFGLASLYTFEPETNDVIWVDDRFVNSFSNYKGVPIVGIQEILSTLEEQGKISRNERFAFLNRLRAANLRFIALDATEILYLLAKAPVQGGKLVENSELLILKRYMAAVLVQGTTLQKPSTAGGRSNPHGELKFILDFGSAVANALALIWAHPEIPNENKPILAEWIIGNLYTNHLGLSHAMGIEHTLENEQLLPAFSHEMLITQVLTADFSSYNDTPSARKEYLNWLYQRWLRISFTCSPTSFKSTVKLLRLLIQRGYEELAEKEASKDQVSQFYRQFCALMPEPILKEVLEDKDFRELIDFKFQVRAGEHILWAHEFWEATHKAVNGEEAEVIPVSDTVPLLFKPHKDDNGFTGVLIYDSQKEETTSLEGWELFLLTDNIDLQKKALARYRSWFDCLDQDFQALSAAILSEESPQRRVEIIEEWKDSDLHAFHNKLRDKLKKQNQFSLDDLIPANPLGLARHLRLPPTFANGTSFATVWENIATDLVGSDTLVNIIYRLWWLPTPLPQIALDHVKRQAESEKRTLVKRLLRTAKSPTATMHLIRLLLDLGMEQPIYARLANGIMWHITSDPFAKELGAFLAILRWVNYRFGLVLQDQDCPHETKMTIVWAHAHHLFSTFLLLRIDHDWLYKTFSEDVQLPIKVFEAGDNFEKDVANPNLVDSKTFLACGIGYVTMSAKPDLGESLRNQIAKCLTIVSGELSFPHPQLLRENNLMPNVTSSFLGLALGETLANVLPEQILTLFQRANLIQFARDLLVNLQNTKDSAASWVGLPLISGSTSDKTIFSAEILALISNADFVEFVKTDPVSGMRALHAAINEAVTAADSEVLAHLYNQVTESTKVFGEKYPIREVSSMDKDQQEEVRYLAGILVDILLSLAKVKKPVEERALQFKEESVKLLSIWDYYGVVGRPIVELFCEILPAGQAKHMWSLLHLFRAS